MSTLPVSSNTPTDAAGQDPSAGEHYPVRQVNQFGEQERLILESIDIDRLAERIGGGFRATSLIQKRLREIVRLVPEANRFDNKHLIANVLEEIEREVIEFEAGAGDGDGVLRATSFDVE